MPNQNCLKGMQCPQCRSRGPFGIVGTALFEVHDDGSNEFTDLEWSDLDSCTCRGCNTRGQVRDFQLPKKKRRKK
jgi:hypothetical protein